MGRQRQDGAALVGEAPLQLQGEHHVGQLALAVGPPAVVAALALEIVEGDAAEVLGPGGDGDHPGAGPVAQQGQQGEGEGDVAQVVGAELELETLAGEGPGRRHHAGVVDQQVEAAVALGDGDGGGGHAGQIGQIQGHQVEGAGGGGGGEQLLAGQLRPGEGTAGQQHGGAPGRQRPGRLQAQATVGPGDQGDAAGLVRDVGDGPAHGDQEARSVRGEAISRRRPAPLKS
ncbi:TetR family transcriptional regulator [Cyanobium sp. Copco_Reservoir_LC18]|nr:TetR family transcriptional regulator [Cyanobium sp. Copco_Reservoir_LC18]